MFRIALKTGTNNIKINKRLLTTNILYTQKITTQLNTDPAFTEIGIVHYTDTQGINIVRQFGTTVVNMFGGKGFDTSVYDSLRTESITKVDNMLDDDHKICNMRMEFNHAHPDLIVHHIYGTLLKKQ